MNTETHIMDEIYNARKLSYEYHITAVPLFCICLVFVAAFGGFISHGMWMNSLICGVFALIVGSLSRDQWDWSDNWAAHADRLERDFYDL